MTRADLEHLIRAAAGITGEREHVIIGAASILGAHPDAPAALRKTMDVDMYPRQRPDLAELLNDIGELSMFHDRFQVYAHPVDPQTATLPRDWEQRLVRVQNANTRDAIGYCLDPHDLAASKLAAGREKDREFVAAMLEHRLVHGRTLGERIELLPVPLEVRQDLASWLARTLEHGAARQHSHDLDRERER